MTKINLLPPEKIKKRAATPSGNLIWLALAVPLIVLIAVGIWWFSLGSKVSEKNDEIKSTKQELEDWQAKNKALEQYEVRLEEIKAKEAVVVQAISGRVYWARILLNIANFCPNDIWLTSISCTSSAEEGTVEFQGFAKQCRNRWNKNINDLLFVNNYLYYPYDPEAAPDYWKQLHPDKNVRIPGTNDSATWYEFHPEGTMGGYYTYYPDYRPIANWIEKMEQIEQFARVWLANATPEYRSYQVNQVAYRPSISYQLVGTDPATGQNVYMISGYPYDANEGDYIMAFTSTAALDMPNAAIGKPIASAPSAAPAAPATQEGKEEGGAEE